MLCSAKRSSAWRSAPLLMGSTCSSHLPQPAKHQNGIAKRSVIHHSCGRYVVRPQLRYLYSEGQMGCPIRCSWLPSVITTITSLILLSICFQVKQNSASVPTDVDQVISG